MNLKINLEKLCANWKDAQCELTHGNEFQLLLAILLSAQTTDRAVNAALQSLFETHPQFSPKDLVHMGQASFYQIIQKIGLAPRKSQFAFEMSQILLEKYQGKVPHQFEELIQLPGVGRKTANVFLNVALGQPTLPVDTHVSRVSFRLGIVSEKSSPLKVEKALQSKSPTKLHKFLHTALVHQGRYICQARKPLCHKCCIQKTCPQQGVKKVVTPLIDNRKKRTAQQVATSHQED